LAERQWNRGDKADKEEKTESRLHALTLTNDALWKRFLLMSFRAANITHIRFGPSNLASVC
jgi:hypothetical protein